MTELLDDLEKNSPTPDLEGKILKVKFSEHIQSGVANIHGEPCMVIRNLPCKTTIVISLEDVETMAQIYAEHCIPEDDVYQ